jgi:hypothetical protein
LRASAPPQDLLEVGLDLGRGEDRRLAATAGLRPVLFLWAGERLALLLVAAAEPQQVAAQVKKDVE